MAMNYFTRVGTESEVRDYLNKMIEDLNYMFTHLDERNFPGLRGIVSELLTPTSQNVLRLTEQVTALSQQIATVQAAAEAAQSSANAAGVNASAALTQAQDAMNTAAHAEQTAQIVSGVANGNVNLINDRSNALRQICLYLATFHGADAQNAVSQALNW